MPAPNEVPVRVNATAEPMYVSLLDDQIRELKQQVHSLTQDREVHKNSAAHWERRANEVQADYENRLLKERLLYKRFAIVMAKFFLWIVLVPTWFGVGTALIALPFYHYFRTNHASHELWFTLVGGVLLFALLVFLDEEAKKQ